MQWRFAAENALYAGYNGDLRLKMGFTADVMAICG